MWGVLEELTSDGYEVNCFDFTHSGLEETIVFSTFLNLLYLVSGILTFNSCLLGVVSVLYAAKYFIRLKLGKELGILTHNMDKCGHRTPYFPVFPECAHDMDSINKGKKLSW